MRVLLLNLYYPPDTSATAKMAQTVVEALTEKHDVTVLCGRPSYDPTERRPWRLFQSEQSARVQIVRVGSSDYPRTQMKKRVFNYLSYVFLAVPLALSLPCNAVLAMTDPPFEGIVGAFVALLKAKPYIYNIRDLYPDMAVAAPSSSPACSPASGKSCIDGPSAAPRAWWSSAKTCAIASSPRESTRPRSP